ALETEAPFAGLPRDEIEIRSNKAASRAAREWAMAHKLEELKLIPQRMYFLFRNDEAGVTWTQSNKPWFGEEGADRLTRFSTFTFFGLIAVALASHWFRVAVLLFIASPAVALLVVLTTSAGFTTAIALTLYMWALVCVILALIAFAGLIVRVLGRGLRALRR